MTYGEGQDAGDKVAPRRGAWIEITKKLREKMPTLVAPRRGAWIEICVIVKTHPLNKSHPAGVRGLKSIVAATEKAEEDVAPRRGAWIEIR